MCPLINIRIMALHKPHMPKSKSFGLFFSCFLQSLMPSVLTRAVLCAGKEAWKRRPLLLSSQICSNYRITSICGSLAAFWLPPPPLFSPLFHSPLFHFQSPPIPHFFCFYFFWLPFMHSEPFFFVKPQLKQSLL